MSGLQIEWEMLRLAIHGWVREGKSLNSLGAVSGVDYTTILKWINRDDAPETIRLGSAVMEAIKDESVRVSEREQADNSGAGH
jgi:hypothetical protein